MKLCLVCQESFEGNDWRCPNCDWEPPSFEGYPCFAPELIYTIDGFDSVAHDRLMFLEEGSFWFRGRNKLLCFTLQKFFPSAQNLFEIGCGTGFVIAGFAKERPDLSLVGGEVLVSAFKHASLRVPQAEFVQIDGRNLPYENEFDVIGAFDVLEHIEEDVLVVGQMHKALKKKSGIILTVPQHQWLWSDEDEMACHKRRYSRKDLINILESSGFKVKWATSFVSLLLPLMVASRFRWRLLREKRIASKTNTEFYLPKSFDYLFERICDVERRFLEKGNRSLPMGGSLLIVAVKE